MSQKITTRPLNHARTVIEMKQSVIRSNKCHLKPNYLVLFCLWFCCFSHLLLRIISRLTLLPAKFVKSTFSTKYSGIIFSVPFNHLTNFGSKRALPFKPVGNVNYEKKKYLINRQAMAMSKKTYNAQRFKGAFILLCRVFSVDQPTKFDSKVVTQAL